MSLAEILIKRGGGMISCGEGLGVMIGTDKCACPPSWVFIDIADATPEGVSEAIAHLKEGRKAWPPSTYVEIKGRRKGRKRK